MAGDVTGNISYTPAKIEQYMYKPASTAGKWLTYTGNDWYKKNTIQYSNESITDATETIGLEDLSRYVVKWTAGSDSSTTYISNGNYVPDNGTGVYTPAVTEWEWHAGTETIAWPTTNVEWYAKRIEDMSVKERLQKKIPYIATPYRKRSGMGECNMEESKARELLLRFIGPKKFSRYIRDGFITFKAPSGKTYQIFSGSGHTIVRKDGQIVEKLCLCIKNHKIPPTDSVVMRLLLLEHSEDSFRKHELIVSHYVPEVHGRLEAA
jgi:hypothetical protein